MHIVEIDSGNLERLQKLSLHDQRKELENFIKERFAQKVIWINDKKISIKFSSKSFSELIHKAGLHKFACLYHLEEIIINGKYINSEIPKPNKKYAELVLLFTTIVKINFSFYEYDFKVLKYRNSENYMYSGHLDIKKPLES